MAFGRRKKERDERKTSTRQEKKSPTREEKKRETRLISQHPFAPGTVTHVYRATEAGVQKNQGNEVNPATSLSQATVRDDGTLKVTKPDEPGEYVVAAKNENRKPFGPHDQGYDYVTFMVVPEQPKPGHPHLRLRQAESRK